MQTFRAIAKPVSLFAVLCFLGLGTYLPAVQATLVSTDTVVNKQQLQQQRARVHEFLQRDEVKAELIARGVDPLQALARVDSMTNTEVQSLSENIDQLPAGGDALGIAVFVFLVLLFTDIMGFTDIFPFVKKPSDRR